MIHESELQVVSMDPTGRSFSSFDAPQRQTNLIWFVYPLRGAEEIWKAQQDRILQSIGQFTGKKVCIIAADDDSNLGQIDRSPWDAVLDVRNDPVARDRVGWAWSMGQMCQQPGITVRLHTKSVTRHHDAPFFMQWWRLGYDALLDFESVHGALRDRFVAGPFRVLAQDLGVPWHYSGGMYAFRNDAIFSGDWAPSARCDPRWYLEAWPALIASREQSVCLQFDNVGDLNRPEAWVQILNSVSTNNGVEGGQSQLSPEVSMGEDCGARISFAVRSLPEVAIVIAGHDSAAQLSGAIETALNQSIECQIVYADDQSIDDSVAVASGYSERGVVVLRTGVREGLCKARNRAVRATKSKYLVTLSPANRLPSDYVEKHLKAMEGNAPFAYGPTRETQAAAQSSAVRDWREYDPWSGGMVNESAMYSRSVFDAAGGWDETIPALWEYDLSLRASRFGEPQTSTAELLRHLQPDARNVDDKESTAGNAPVSVSLLEFIRRKRATLTISSLLSGRLPSMTERWLARIAESVSSTSLSSRVSLQLWVHRNRAIDAEGLYRIAEKHGSVFSDIKVRSIAYEVPTAPDPDRYAAIATLLARYSASAQSLASSDLLWLIEDDILVPANACAALFHEVTSGEVPPMAVSGVYRNRHTRWKMLGGWLNGTQRYEPREFSEDVQQVDFVGTGCLMFWTSRPSTPRVWQPYCRVDPQPAHDFAWAEAVQDGLFMHGGVRCGHATSDSEILL